MKNNVQNVAWAESVRREVFKNTETILRNHNAVEGVARNAASAVSLGVMNTLLMSMIACEITVIGSDHGEEVKLAPGTIDRFSYCGVRSDFDVKVGGRVIYVRPGKISRHFPVGAVVYVRAVNDVAVTVLYHGKEIILSRDEFFDGFDPIVSERGEDAPKTDDKPSIWISPVDGHPHAVVDGWIYSCGYMPVPGKTMIADREYKKGHENLKSIYSKDEAAFVHWQHLSRFKLA